MENQNTPQNQTPVQRLNIAIEELIKAIQNQKARYSQELDVRSNRIAGLQAEIQNLNNALANRKNLIEELDNKNKLLVAQVGEMQNKLNLSAGNSEETARLQQALSQANAQISEWEQKYNKAEEELKNHQHEIDETSTQINGVITRLEKVLEENGTSNDNN